MIFKILLVLFFFFTQKQIYASRHFRGAAISLGAFLGIFGCASFIFEIYAFINIAIKETIGSAILLYVIAVVCTFIINSIITKIVIASAPIPSMYLCNHQCDMVATTIAIIGILYNLFFVVFYFLSNV